MKTKYKYLLNFLLVGSDLLQINIVYFCSIWLLNWIRGMVILTASLPHLVIYNIFWMGAAGYWGLYNIHQLHSAEDVYRATWRAVATQAIVYSVSVSVAYSSHQSREFIAVLIALNLLSFLITRFLFTVLDVWFRHRHPYRRRVAVLGNNLTGMQLTDYFSHHPNSYDFAGTLLQLNSPSMDSKDAWYQNMVTGIKKANELEVQELYAALAPERMSDVKNLMVEAKAHYIQLKVVPDINMPQVSDLRFNFLNDFPVLSQQPQAMDNMRGRAQKRVFDILFSSLVLVFLMSWLYPLIALLIRLQSPGPVLFTQQRSGRNNNPFWCYKFRSMRLNKESDQRQATKHDERITPVGRLLRRTSLDELPQFFNVLIGEMSVVGPRPHMLVHTEQYKAVIDSFMIRQSIKPGITGWAQINGLRGQTNEDSQMAKRLEKDLEYMKRWSFMLDIRIIFLTVFLTIKGDKNVF